MGIEKKKAEKVYICIVLAKRLIFAQKKIIVKSVW